MQVSTKGKILGKKKHLLPQKILVNIIIILASNKYTGDHVEIKYSAQGFKLVLN